MPDIAILEPIEVAPTYIQHPPSVAEENYSSADPDKGAIAVVLLKARGDDGRWIPTAIMQEVRFMDYPAVHHDAVGTEGEPGYVAAFDEPPYSLITLPGGIEKYRLDGVQIGADANEARYEMVTQATPLMTRYAIPPGTTFAEAMLAFNNAVGALVVADMQRKAQEGV